MRAACPGNTVQEGKDDCADSRQNQDRSKGTGKHHRRQQFAGVDDDLRPENGGDDPSRQHEGDGARLELGRRIVGGGETELLDEGATGADDGEAKGKQPEACMIERERRDQAAKSSDDGAGHEAASMTEPADDGRGRQGAERHAEVEAGDGRRRQRLVGSEQILACERAERDGNGCGRADDRLRRGEQQRRAAPCLAGLGYHGRSDGHEASLPRPSPRTRRETRSSTALTSFGSSSS